MDLSDDCRRDVLGRIQNLKAEISLIEAILQPGSPSSELKDSDFQGLGPTAAIMKLLDHLPTSDGLTAAEISERLINSVQTKAENKRQLIQATVMNLKGKKRLVNENGKYRLALPSDRPRNPLLASE